LVSDIAPALLMLRGTPTRRFHDYVRNGVADLYALTWGMSPIPNCFVEAQSGGAG
jgi:hypothetical protein